MERLLYTSLLAWKDKPGRKPLILKGARQVGKTHLLKLFGQEFPQFHYVNFEKDKNLHALFELNLDPRRVVNELGLHFKIDIRDNDLIIFDEIQACPNAITILKYFCEEMPQMAVCAAGSLLGLELGSVSYPVGKVDMLHLGPLNFFEFLMACGRNKELDLIKTLTPFSETTHDSLWRLLKNYFIIGGLPEAVNTFLACNQTENHNTYKQVREKQENLITTYLADMAKHSGKQNAMSIERLWKNIPEQLARENDETHSRFQFKNVIPGVKAFSRLVGIIDWLEKAGLILKVKIVHRAEFPLVAFTKENRFKLYLFDVGLLGSLSGLSPEVLYQMSFGTYKGFVAENFVAEELTALGFHSLYSWAENSSEIEFLLEQKGDFLPIEVKAGKKTRSKSLAIFCKDISPKRAYLLNAKRPQFSQPGPRQHYPLYFISRLMES